MWVISDGTNFPEFVDDTSSGIPFYEGAYKFWEITISDDSVLTLKFDGNVINYSGSFTFDIPNPMKVILGDGYANTGCEMSGFTIYG